MSETLQQLMPQIERLSVEERAELAHYLLTSLEPEEDPAAVKVAWREELARRGEEIHGAKVIGIPGDQVLAELRERYP
jgi:putative addiction module component (TIGR02574 family)